MRRVALLWGVFILPENGYTVLSIVIERVLPMNQNLNLKQQLRCIYTSDFFSGLRITDAVWVALLAARGFSLWEIGLAESVYHIVSLFCEVPSGMAADLLGRRKTLLSGGVLTVTCNLLMAFAPNLFTICLAMGLNALAMTMFSGTFTALVYDSLKTEGREDEYIQVSANSSQIAMLANAVGSLASLLKRFLGFAGFYLLSAAFEGVSTAALALMEEPIVTKAQASRGRQTLRALPGQFTKLARNSLSILRTTPLAAKLIVSSAVVSVPSYLTKMFVQQRLIELGWPTEFLFLPLLLGGAACVLGAEVGRRVRFRSMRRFYSVCALLCGVGTLLVGLAPAWGGLFGMMLVQGLQSAHDPRQPPRGCAGRRLRSGRGGPCGAGCRDPRQRPCRRAIRIEQTVIFFSGPRKKGTAANNSLRHRVSDDGRSFATVPLLLRFGDREAAV